MEIIPILHNEVGSQFMTRGERRIIVETFDKFKHDWINFLRWVEVLKEIKFIDDDTYTKVLRKYRHLSSHQKEDQHLFVFASLNHLTFDMVVATVKNIGCTEIAKILIHERFKTFFLHMTKATVSNVDFGLSYYQRMKACIDNHVFANPIDDLKRLIFLETAIIRNEDIFTGRRQRAADKVVPLYVLLVQKYWSRGDRIRVLEEMKQSVPSDLDTTTVESVYHSKIAITEAIVGNKAKAIEHAQTAESLCFNREPCLAAILSTHDQQYLYRQLYMITFRQEYLDEILRLGDRVMETTMAVDEETRNQWKRLALLFQALSLLKITSQFDVIESIPPNQEQLDKVECILKEVSRISHKAEVRREMIYSICMARFKEIIGALEAAMTYLDEAVRLSNDGGIFFPLEKENIDRYMGDLKHKFISYKYDQGLVFAFGETTFSDFNSCS